VLDEDRQRRIYLRSPLEPPPHRLLDITPLKVSEALLVYPSQD
jgi:hypothetical protein